MRQKPFFADYGDERKCMRIFCVEFGYLDNCLAVQETCF